MLIKKISLKNFRNHQSLYFDFSNNLNVLTGPNAIGKTNVVEAIYYLSLGRSFRTSEDIELIKKNHERAEIDATITEGELNRKIKVVIHGNGTGSLSDFDGDVVPKAPLSVSLQKSILPLVDQNHMMMGNQKITSGMFDTILYDGGPVINVWAPIGEDGNIDFERMAQFNELIDYIKQQPDLTLQDKNLLLQKYGFNGTIDENNKFVGSGPDMAQFLVFTGLTTDEVIDPKENIYADKLSRDQKKLEETQIERIYAQLNKGLKKGQFEFKTSFFGSDFIKAPVFLKLGQTAQIDVETLTGHGPVIRNKTYEEMNVYDQARYNRPQIQTPSSSIL